MTDPKLSSDEAWRAALESERREALVRHAKIVEEERFYNASEAQADFDHWIHRLWSLDEAVALSLGKNPALVNSATIAHLEEVWPFAREYVRRTEFFVKMGFDETALWPGMQIITWANRVGVDLPQALRAASNGSGKTEPENLEVAYQTALARIAKLERELRSRADENPKSGKTSDRLVYALALKFKFESTGRSSAATLIHQLLDNHQVHMDRGVILERLQGAVKRREEDDL